MTFKDTNDKHLPKVSEVEATKLRGDDKRKYIVTLFDKIATRYDFIRTLIFLGHTSRWYRKALSDLDLKQGDKVLDVGCGTGESTRYLSRLYQGVAVEGMDISPGMLAVAHHTVTIRAAFILKGMSAPYRVLTQAIIL